MLGIKQAELAHQAEISPSYLNLIEHNRRRIGGKLLSAIAGALDVDPGALAEGAEAALIAGLREAASAEGGAAELDRAEEFAGRFPGWAALLSEHARRVASLEQTVETLTDRLTHDPFLSDSLHDILTTVTAIRSTASILVETREIEAEWRDRFLRNINEDSQRLTGASKALVRYLDGVDDIDASMTSPQEELDAFLGRHGYHFERIENSPGDDPASWISETEIASGSSSAQTLAIGFLRQYARDAAAMPMGQVEEAIKTFGLDMAALAGALRVELVPLFRRLAMLPTEVVGTEIGLATCDASGTLLIRKPLGGFGLPRFGAACPLWPLFQSLSRPMVPIRARLVMAGRGDQPFETYAVARQVGTADFATVPRFEAAMLFHAAGRDKVTPQPVGISCRICPLTNCDARREPSILSQGL